MRRKTRKYPDMIGSIRRKKKLLKDQKQAIAFQKWYDIAFGDPNF